MSVQPSSATAPVKSLAGTVAAPGITFTGDTDTGLFQPAANQVAVTTGGVQRLLIGADGTITPSGSLLFPAGSASFPSISFTGDTNTGIYSPSADSIAVATSGTGRLFVDADGNVGVGAAPTTRLEVARLGAAWTGVEPIPGTALFVHSGSAITTSPTRLSILSGNAAKAAIYFGDTDNNAEVIIELDNTDDSLRFNVNGSERLRITSTGQLSFIGGGSTGSPAVGFNGSAPSNSLVIDSTGNVGIGVSSPQLPFTIGLGGGAAPATSGSTQSSGGIARLGSSGAATLDVGTLASGTAWLQATNVTNLATNYSLLLNPNGGNVGIGTTNPRSKLTVAGQYSIDTNTTDPNDGATYLFQEGGVGWNLASTNIAFSTGTSGSRSESARIDSSGRLLVGTSTSIDVGTYTNSFIQVKQDNSSTQAGLSVVAEGSSGTTFPRILMSRANSSGAAVINNSALGLIQYAGYDSNQNYIPAASIQCAVDGTPGTNDMPGRLVFSTTADGASSPTERMRIDSSGNVGINTTSPGSKLAVNGSITESTDNGTTYHNVVTAQDIGTDPNQVPLNQFLGQLAFMDSIGDVPTASSAPQDNLSINFEYVSDTSIKIRMRGSDGVVRSVTLTLS